MATMAIIIYRLVPPSLTFGEAGTAVSLRNPAGSSPIELIKSIQRLTTAIQTKDLIIKSFINISSGHSMIRV